MPQVGQDYETGRIIRWIKKAGDAVKKGDAICEVETEKAVVEVPAPADGWLVKVLYPDDTEVKILTGIAFIGDTQNEIDESIQKSLDQKEKITQASPDHDEIQKASASRADRMRISPKAKKLAVENKIPLEKLQGSGPLGRIVEKDVREYINHQPAVGTKKMGTCTQTEKGVIPLNKIRKVAAQRLLHSKQTIPHFYISLSADMSPALKMLKQLNERYNLPKGETISVTDLLVRAAALALKEFPAIYATYTEEGIQLSDHIDLGVAVAVEDGLVVPVVEDCDLPPLRELSSRIRQVVVAARAGRQLMTRPGRFTISNLGMYQVDEFAAIINPPEVAILAVGSIRKQLEVSDDSSISIRDRIKLTLSVDHRVVDGVMAAKFLNHMRRILEEAQDF